MRAKQDMFISFSGNKWKIKYNGTMPQIHTLRELTIAEQEDPRNKALKGVRTYYFFAHHWRGHPEMEFNEASLYNDYAWIPKRKLNEYFTQSYHEVFIDGLQTR